MPFIAKVTKPCPDCFNGISKEPDPALVADPEVPRAMTWKPCETCPDPKVGPTGTIVVSRLAVATLEEARASVDDRVADAYYKAQKPGDELPPVYFELSTAARELPESGGTITLPDGKTVEVEIWTWQRITGEIGWPRSAPYGETEAREIIAAFNAKFAAGSPSVAKEGDNRA